MKKVTNSTNSLAELDLELEIMQRDYMAFSCDGPIYKKLNDFLAAVDEAEGKYRLILNLANCQVWGNIDNIAYSRLLVEIFYTVNAKIV